MGGQNSKSFQVETVSLEAVTDASLWNYGMMRDHCRDISAKFVGGKIYGIVGECGAGGWALSYTLAGKQKSYSGEILVDGQIMDYRGLKELACYVGEGINDTGSWFGYKKTVIRQIKDGISTGKSSIKSVNDIVELFGLADDQSRLNRNIYQVSNLRWLASIAIGYAYGRKVYCFPWLNSGWIKLVRSHIDKYLKVLKESGAIIIIPTSKVESIEDITCDTMYVKDTIEEG